MRPRVLLPSLRSFARLVGAAALVALQAAVAVAQTPYIPYFGKNNVHYDTFNWQIYTTDHFEIYFYPEVQPHLERIASYAESAYQQISADLKHDLSFKVQLIIFKTHSEFEQENIEPGAGQEGVGAFAEPFRQRIVAPIDDPPDRLYGLIVHELTHQFEFDIIPADADPPQRAAVGERRPVRLRARAMGTARPHGGPRRGDCRHRAAR